MTTKRGDGQKWIEENQGKHFCQCGCGEVIEIKIHHHVRGIPRFKNFHAWKVIKPGLGKCGEKNNNYHGGKYTDRRGYVLVLVPGPGRSKYKFEHRIVVESEIGRELSTDETVHHENRNKSENAIDNLEVIDRAEHARIHAVAGETGFGLLKRKGKSWNRHQQKV